MQQNSLFEEKMGMKQGKKLELKNARNALKKSLSALIFNWWGQIDKVRTFLLESVNDEDSFLRTLKIA